MIIIVLLTILLFGIGIASLHFLEHLLLYFLDSVTNKNNH